MGIWIPGSGSISPTTNPTSHPALTVFLQGINFYNKGANRSHQWGMVVGWQAELEQSEDARIRADRKSGRRKGLFFGEAMFYNQMMPRYSNTTESIVQFKNQDFTSLRNHCLRRGRLFEDAMFPANDSAIGQILMNEKAIRNPEWRRPKELSGTSSPHFILDGISKFDIQQGEAGDCWFLAALGSLTHKPELLAKIIPTNQSFAQGYAGIFHFQFWQCGQWVDVVVDDRLPVSSISRKYLFVYPRGGSNQFWPCLLEKAYAKLHGSYFQLHYGIMADSLVELTGWVVTKVNLQEVHLNLFKNLKAAEQSGSLITCGIASSNNFNQSGLVNNHAYTVTGSEEVILDTGREELIRLWNPWGRQEWTERWSDNSPEWQRVQESERTRLYKKKEDGEFWMSLQDFQKLFTSMFICYQYPMVMNDRELDNGTWFQIPYEVKKIQGNIVQDSSSDALGNTLQYFFSVTEPMESINVVVSINIQPDQSRKMMLLFKVYKFHDLHNPLNPMYFEFTSHIRGKNVISRWNHTESFHLVPGTYVVVLTVDRERKFFLRIFLKHQGVYRKLCKGFKFTSFKKNLPELQHHEIIFNRYAQQGPDMDASQLQSLLNKELLKSNSSESLERKFTFDECRSILALMDVKANGRLDIQEFRQLWKKLIRYQGIFWKVEKNGSGFLMGFNLQKVIQESELFLDTSINSELLDLMAIRYGDGAGKIYLADIICFLIRIEIMSRAFHNLSKDGKGLYLTKTEWIKFTMYC
ncbi:calpain-13 [Vombatus ursinus]|uniref:calpain-13 n=1 Tax=Vombatus ursinus TaxID=29139 RepID=UPI000FFDAC13|nr:calpain-13 [Vombatus ursinus]